MCESGLVCGRGLMCGDATKGEVRMAYMWRRLHSGAAWRERFVQPAVRRPDTQRWKTPPPRYLGR